jgi:hypothetical protein
MVAPNNPPLSPDIDPTKTSGTAEINTKYNYPTADILNLIPEQSFITEDRTGL